MPYPPSSQASYVPPADYVPDPPTADAATDAAAPIDALPAEGVGEQGEGVPADAPPSPTADVAAPPPAGALLAAADAVGEGAEGGAMEEALVADEAVQEAMEVISCL